MNFQKAIQAYAEQPITSQLLLDMLKAYKRPYDKIDELVKQQMLLQVRRGLYIPGSGLGIALPEPLLIANHLYGPSYVSLESALSYWGLIPEHVYETSSMTTMRSKTFKTTAGRYSYLNLPLPYYSFGIQQVQLTSKQTVLIASPEKALCDKIISTSGILLRSVKQTRELLIEDFRIEGDALRKLNTNTIDGWLSNAPKANSLKTMVKTLESI